MALIVSLDRGAIKVDLGDYSAVALTGNELRALDKDGGALIAKHMHNRWLASARHGEAFMTLNIAGPLVIELQDGEASRLGPYMLFCTTDGILYVEQRVLGLWDTQTGDWYVKDAGRHSSRLRIAFHATD